MKYYIYRFDGGDVFEVPGVFQEGELVWIEIQDADLPTVLRKLMERWQVMLLPPKESFNHYSIWLDTKKFRQR